MINAARSCLSGLGVATVLACAGSASAATISVTQTLGPTPTYVITSMPFAKFDPSLGTLTGVTISASATQNAPTLKLTWNGTAASPSNRFLRYAFDWNSSISQGSTVIASGAAEAPANSDPTSPFTNWGSFALPAGLEPGQHVTFSDPSWVVSINNTVNIAAGDLATYIGLDSVAVDISLTNFFGISFLNNWNMQLTTTATASVTVEYTYTPIPTPAAASLLGLAGVVASRRRR